MMLRDSTTADRKRLKTAFSIANCCFRLLICNLKRCFNAYRSALLDSCDSSKLPPIPCDVYGVVPAGLSWDLLSIGMNLSFRMCKQCFPKSIVSFSNFFSLFFVSVRFKCKPRQRKTQRFGFKTIALTHVHFVNTARRLCSGIFNANLYVHYKPLALNCVKFSTFDWVIVPFIYLIL